jgi:hypothetical protein
MKRLSGWLAALALLGVQAVASAQVSSTYNFTGIVTGASGSPPIQVVAGDTVTGTFSFGPVSNVSTTASFSGGSFGFNATVDNMTWPPASSVGGPESSGAAYGTYSPNALPNQAVWALIANEFVENSPEDEGSGAFAYLQFASTTTPTWTTSGEPVFAPGVSATGDFGFAWGGGYCCGDYQVNYVVTSVSPVNGPGVTISVSPANIISGKSFTLTWSSTNATNCTATGEGQATYPWHGPLNDSGSLVMQAQPGDFTFWISCSSVTDSSLVGWAQASLSSPPTVTFTASNTQPAVGQSFTLTWSSVGANACTSAADGPNGTTFWNGTVALSGTLNQTLTTAGEYSYSLTCTEGPLQVIRSIQVNVGAAASTGASTSTSASPAHGGGGALSVFELLCLVFVLTVRLSLRAPPARRASCPGRVDGRQPHSELQLTGGGGG